MKLFIWVLSVIVVFLVFSLKTNKNVYAAEVSCAQVDVYVINSATGQNIPDARVGLRCTNGGSYCGGTDPQHVDGACWENSGYQNVPFPPSSTAVFFDGYDCDKGGGQLYAQLQAGWTWQCTTDGSRYDCSQGSNLDVNNLGLQNGAHSVVKIFYAPPPPTATPTFTPTPTPTLTPSPTPTPTIRPTATTTPTATSTITPTSTPGVCQAPPTVTNVRIECPFCPPSYSPTQTLTPTFTITPTSTPRATSTPTPTRKPTSTPTPTNRPTSTPTPTITMTPTPTPTLTPSPTPTPSPSPLPTNTPIPTPTSTSLPTPSFTPIPTRVIVLSSPTPTLPPSGVNSFIFGVGGIIVTIIGGALFLLL